MKLVCQSIHSFLICNFCTYPNLHDVIVGSRVRIMGQPYGIKQGNVLNTHHTEKVTPAGIDIPLS